MAPHWKLKKMKNSSIERKCSREKLGKASWSIYVLRLKMAYRQQSTDQNVTFSDYNYSSESYFFTLKFPIGSSSFYLEVLVLVETPWRCSIYNHRTKEWMEFFRWFLNNKVWNGWNGAAKQSGWHSCSSAPSCLGFNARVSQKKLSVEILMRLINSAETIFSWLNLTKMLINMHEHFIRWIH